MSKADVSQTPRQPMAIASSCASWVWEVKMDWRSRLIPSQTHCGISLCSLLALTADEFDGFRYHVVCIQALNLCFSYIWICLCPMSGDLLSCGKPDIVIRSEMVDNPLQCYKSPRSSDPPGMQCDGNVSRLALESLFSDHTKWSTWPSGKMIRLTQMH